MLFERIDKARYSVLTLHSRQLDLNANKELKEHFIECKKNHVGGIVLDLSACEMITSEGIGFFIYLWHYYMVNGSMTAVIRSENIIELLKDCGLYLEMKDFLFSDLAGAERTIAGKQTAKLGVTHSKTGSCPSCKSTNVGFYDTGFKWFLRLLKGKKPRRICNDCYLVFRHK